ncbi:Fc.00g093440.m01.CDS01 [Cosmosporella sp. VM-42]
MSARISRSTTVLRPAILNSPTVSQRGFCVSRQARQSTQPPQPPKSTPEVKNQNTYVAAGAGAVGLGFLFWYITGKPEKANELADEASKKLPK